MSTLTHILAFVGGGAVGVAVCGIWFFTKVGEAFGSGL